MPCGSSKEKRMFKHIKESEEAAGKGEKKAEAIAGAIINKRKHELLSKTPLGRAVLKGK